MELTTRSTSQPSVVSSTSIRTCARIPRALNPSVSWRCSVWARQYAFSRTLAFLLCIGAPIIGCLPFTVLSASCCEHFFGISTVVSNASNFGACDNSAAPMLDPEQPSSSAPSPGTTSSTCTVPVVASPSFTLSQQDLAQAFSQALGESLLQILAAF